jgi:homoserine kinase
MRVTVRVPATSANLGPGFDTFGLALDLCNDVTVDTDVPAGVVWEGEGADELPTDGTDMVSQTIAAIAARVEMEPPPFAVRSINRIPVGRGLGSSSAAAVAGVVLASRVLDLGLDGDGGDPYSVFANAAEIEGHPDNAAPAAFGGATIVVDGFVRRLEPHPDLRPVALVADTTLSTAEARDALPQRLPLEDAVFNVGHAALMVEALTRDPHLLRVALRDRLHQRARLELVPESADLFEDLGKAHIPVCVSGAGPSLLAFPLDGDEVPDHLLPSGWRSMPLPIRNEGFTVDG